MEAAWAELLLQGRSQRRMRSTPGSLGGCPGTPLGSDLSGGGGTPAGRARAREGTPGTAQGWARGNCTEFHGDKSGVLSPRTRQPLHTRASGAARTGASSAGNKLEFGGHHTKESFQRGNARFCTEPLGWSDISKVTWKPGRQQTTKISCTGPASNLPMLISDRNHLQTGNRELEEKSFPSVTLFF